MTTFAENAFEQRMQKQSFGMETNKMCDIEVKTYSNNLIVDIVKEIIYYCINVTTNLETDSILARTQ